MVKKLLILFLGIFFLAACGSAPKTSAKHATVKRYSYYDEGDPAKQDAIEDLIYSELSKSQQALLKKYKVPIGSSSLAGIRFDIPVTMNDKVSEWIDYFANGGGRKYYERWLGRSTRFVPLQLEILRENGLPRDIIFLSMIESGFNTHAYSFAAASGLWQFIRSTGRLYGLESDYWLDERRDPEKATLAAARHLKDLYEEFGDWYLAFAAYNAGAGKINRAIDAAGTRNFWEIAQTSYIRQETKDYVPKILAAAIIAKSPEKYGFRDVEYQDPIATEKVTIPSPTDLDVIAQCAGVDTDLIRLVNPELIRNMTPPNRPGYVLNLPRGTKDNFQARYARLDSAERLKNVRYVAQKGESLRSIAQDHGVTVSSLMAANPSLENRRSVPSRTTLIVPKAYDSPPPMPISTTYASASRGKRLIDLIADRSDESDGKKSKKKKKEEKIAPPSDRTEDGEMKVAWKAPEKASAGEGPQAAPSQDSGNPAPESSPSADEGSPKDVKTAEAAPGTTESDGGAIGVKHSWEEPAPSPARSPARQRTLAYRVKKGDTLNAIADKYNVSVADLREWNHLSAKRGLLANQRLVIRTTESEKERRGGFSLIRSAYADEGSRTAKKRTPALVSKTPRVIAYKVRKGDTLHGIARKYDVTPSEIIAMNGLSKRAVIRPGLVLKIPAKNVSRG